VVRAGRHVLCLVTVAMLGAGGSAVAGAGAVQAAPGMGRAASGGSPALVPGSLKGVSADSATDAWAVGGYFNSANVGQTLILHWNGTSWKRVRSPNPGPTSDGLGAVSAVSRTDAWAVGATYDKSTNVTSTLILHWNGTAWSQVKSPNPSAGYNVLEGVSAVSSTDAWAVGNYQTPNGLNNKSLLLHWNGTAWSKVKVPNPGASTALNGVSAVSGTDAWAVGGTYDKSTNALSTLALHWNGTAWSRAATPTPAGNGMLSGVSTLSSTGAWAIGDLALHWDGTTWSDMVLPIVSRAGFETDGVSAVSGKDVWVVGSASKNTRFRPVSTVILRWNGTAWSRVKSPSPGTTPEGGISELFAVTAVSRTDVWAVGDYSGPPTGTDALILHWNGHAWSMS